MCGNLHEARLLPSQWCKRHGPWIRPLSTSPSVKTVYPGGVPWHQEYVSKTTVSPTRYSRAKEALLAARKDGWALGTSVGEWQEVRDAAMKKRVMPSTPSIHPMRTRTELTCFTRLSSMFATCSGRVRRGGTKTSPTKFFETPSCFVGADLESTTNTEDETQRQQDATKMVKLVAKCSLGFGNPRSRVWTKCSSALLMMTPMVVVDATRAMGARGLETLWWDLSIKKR